MESLRAKQGYICDMDGVIYHGNMLLPGVKQFIDWLEENHKNYLFLTNSSERSPRELQQKLLRMGLHVDVSHFYTSALATPLSGFPNVRKQRLRDRRTRPDLRAV